MILATLSNLASVVDREWTVDGVHPISVACWNFPSRLPAAKVIFFYEKNLVILPRIIGI